MKSIISQKISVIIPVYNEERDISDCLSSLLSQDYPDFEIIVVDDGSNDSTAEIIRKFPVQLLSQKHFGAGSARNLGAKLASGKILVFVDADMTFVKSFLSELVKPIIDGKAIGTFSKEEYVSNSDNFWSQCWSINKNLPITKMLPIDYPDTQPVFRAILKSEFDRISGFDLIGYNDDWTLTKKLGVQAVVVKNATFYHRNPDSLIEIWQQASWIGRRTYRLGIIGKIITLIRTNFIFSLILGMYKSLRYIKPRFIVFKIIYDFAIFKSVLFSFISSKNYK